MNANYKMVLLPRNYYQCHCLILLQIKLSYELMQLTKRRHLVPFAKEDTVPSAIGAPEL